MLNTLYPPTTIPLAQFVQPTAQLTPQILSAHRNGFFRYINAVEKNGPAVLRNLMDQQKKPGDASGWTSLRDTLDKYLREANTIIEDCYEITGRDSINSPTAASFSSADLDDDGNRRKVDSGVSFTSDSSSRGSVRSHQNRPGTSSTTSTHSRQHSKEKPLPEKPLPMLTGEEKVKPHSSTLERIAREIRKIRSRGDIRDASKSRPATAVPVSNDVIMADSQEDRQPPSPTKERRLRPKLSLRKLRSNNALRERDANAVFSSSSAPTSRDGGYTNDMGEVPAFDVEEMKRRRMIWEAQERKKNKSSKGKHHSGDFMEMD